MAKAEFPLSKNNSFRLGKGWEYCVHELSCDANGPMRLLIAFNPAKREYLAWLALATDTDQALVARLEYHRSHLGWHVHMKPKRLDTLAWGVVKQQGETLLPCDSGQNPDIGKGEAESLAFSIFNVSHSPWGLA